MKKASKVEDKTTNQVSPDDIRTALLRKKINEFERCVTLLKATYNLLKKQVESPFVLNILEEMVFYDETDCDGYCLYGGHC